MQAPFLRRTAAPRAGPQCGLSKGEGNAAVPTGARSRRSVTGRWRPRDKTHTDSTAGNLAALIVEFFGSGCRSEGAGNEPLRRPCGLSALNSLARFGVSLRIAKSPVQTSRELSHKPPNHSPKRLQHAWSRPRFDEHGEMRSRSQPIIFKVWLNIIEACSSPKLLANLCLPLETPRAFAAAPTAAAALLSVATALYRCRF